ncbi:MAG TPA: hypothetical protein VMU16_03405 [Candidatus Binataceae bacterium]|nr:hypothetical protein [Candidatus Binataceae bacterium]
MRDAHVRGRFIPVLLVLLACGAIARPAAGGDPQSQAARLSDGAFSLLSTINTGGSGSNPLLAPVASLAGDAQSLASALAVNDNAKAGRAMASIINDRTAIDGAAKGAAGFNAAQWSALKDQIATLEKEVPKSSAPKAAEPAPSESESTGPQVRITSRVIKNGVVRVRGYIMGTDLKSAGVFNQDRMLKEIALGATPGEQRVTFDLSLQAPGPGESIRAIDGYGRQAEAIAAPDGVAVGSTRGGAELIDIEPAAGMSDAPIVADSEPTPNTNTAEISSETDAASPSRRHLRTSPLAPLVGVEIDIIYAEELISAPGNVEVIGQITGPGVVRAGVYTAGRLIRQIPINTSGFTSFDVVMRMPPPLADTTIRAYGAGSNFVESSINIAANPMAEMENSPIYQQYPVYPPPYYVPNPYVYGNPYANPYYRPAPNPGYRPPATAPAAPWPH